MREQLSGRSGGKLGRNAKAEGGWIEVVGERGLGVAEQEGQCSLFPLQHALGGDDCAVSGELVGFDAGELAVVDHGGVPEASQFEHTAGEVEGFTSKGERGFGKKDLQVLGLELEFEGALGVVALHFGS